ncbi:MAG: hypothetical protein D6796_10185, partial [Caldilineae bacterium]
MNIPEPASSSQTELHQRAAELTALLEVTRRLAATRNLQDLLTLAAGQIVAITEVRGCALLRCDEETETLTVWMEHRRRLPDGGGFVVAEGGVVPKVNAPPPPLDG